METELVNTLRRSIEPIVSLSHPSLDGFVERAHSARVCLLGESTHGTVEFYELRAKMTLRLIDDYAFNIVCLEADWPDVELINDYIHGRRDDWSGFHRFPQWMWRNHSFADFVDELRDRNLEGDGQPISVFGLDIMSLSASLEAVLHFLERRDPEAFRLAQQAETCFAQWRHDPTQYGLHVCHHQVKTCEREVLNILKTMHERRLQLIGTTDSKLLSALQNARVVHNAEEYYRAMYESAEQSWNLRDRHMFETLLILLDHFGKGSRAVIWEHNSHIGDARATEMNLIGELNLGQLCRTHFGQHAYLAGFLTDHGTVMAASCWGGPARVKTLNPGRADSYEGLFHSLNVPAFHVPFRHSAAVSRHLREPRLERAVGVIYQPDKERNSHYFRASLSSQFDEITWVDQTSAVKPLRHSVETEEPDTYPFGI